MLVSRTDFRRAQRSRLIQEWMHGMTELTTRDGMGRGNHWITVLALRFEQTAVRRFGAIRTFNLFRDLIASTRSPKVAAKYSPKMVGERSRSRIAILYSIQAGGS